MLKEIRYNRADNQSAFAGFWRARQTMGGGLIISELLKFANREEFHGWLCEHCLSSEGSWILFGEAGGPKTIKAGEALEEALCFGWIDGQMEKIDDKMYKKYFSLRRENSKWSERIGH